MVQSGKVRKLVSPHLWERSPLRTCAGLFLLQSQIRFASFRGRWFKNSGRMLLVDQVVPRLHSYSTGVGLVGLQISRHDPSFWCRNFDFLPCLYVDDKM